MRILINDFGGYPFPIQLSKYLADNGYDVGHTYVSNILTPHGDMNITKGSKLTILPITLNSEFKKYSAIGRFKGEFEFATKVSAIITQFKPDIFISANTPLLAQHMLLNKCNKSKIKFIYWCQDIHSIALEAYLIQRLPVIGKIMAAYFRRKEIRLLEKSDHVITISNSFNDVFNQMGVIQKRLSVIHNWGPISEITVEPKVNSWSQKNGTDAKFVILYSGTLGLKHNPKLISLAAAHFKTNKDLLFLVISEGIGATMLQEQKINEQLDNLLILPYQDYKDLPNVLGSADVLLAILEPRAAIFSVPSKVLTYLCSQKPLVLSVPKNNLSAKIVSDTKSGYCIEPEDTAGLISSINTLINNSTIREEMGERGRKYAEENFEISVIANKFIKVFETIK